MDALNTFVQKLKTGQEKLKREILQCLWPFQRSYDDVNDALSSEILVHLTSLRKKFLRYFPEIAESDLKLVMTYRMTSLTLKMILLVEI